MKLEYRTTFFPVDYPVEKGSKWLLGLQQLPHAPDEDSLIENPEYQKQMQMMGERGWELVSVQPLLEGIYMAEAPSFAYSITAGYYFFWKRVIEE